MELTAVLWTPSDGGGSSEDALLGRAGHGGRLLPRLQHPGDGGRAAVSLRHQVGRAAGRDVSAPGQARALERGGDCGRGGGVYLDRRE